MPLKPARELADEENTIEEYLKRMNYITGDVVKLLTRTYPKSVRISRELVQQYTMFIFIINKDQKDVSYSITIRPWFAPPKKLGVGELEVVAIYAKYSKNEASEQTVLNFNKKDKILINEIVDFTVNFTSRH